MVAVTDGEVLDQCASDVGFLWTQRAAAVHDPRHDLKSLRALDLRVEARLDVLREGGAAGREGITQAIADGGGAGELFAAAVLALEKGAQDWWGELLALGAPAPGPARGLISAVGWTLGQAPSVRKKAFFEGLLAEGAPPAQIHVGIAASAVCRHDPGAALGAALRAEDGPLRARALRAVGELGRRDLLSSLALGAEDPRCRFWAAWSATLLGDGAGMEVLKGFAHGKGPLAERACGLLVRRMDPLAAVPWLERLAGTPAGLRSALVGAGALGDPALIPWVLTSMEAPKVARLAGGVLTLITSVDLDREKLVSEPPEGFDDAPGDEEEIAPDMDDGLPWPDVAAVRAWWAQRGGAFARGVRHLWGKPIGPAWLEEVLGRGSQPARAAAAVERCWRRPERGLFEVRARGDRQAMEVGGELSAG